ncbi:MAG TPA: cytochrome c [Longimicrobiales bacterium]|nr:cytochrome c [Longimicrobiales bacterium]
MTGTSARTAGLAVLGTLLVLALGGLVFLYSGAYNVAATEDHTVLGRWALGTGLERSVAVRARDVAEPPAVDADMLAHGFDHYRAMCVVCHGAPGIERGEFGQGMTPTPPDLAESAREWGARELFWITKHGIKLAGMPAFGPTHSDEELWGIVAFLQALADMTPEEYAELEAQYAAGADSAAGSGQGGHSHAPGTPAHGH